MAILQQEFEAATELLLTKFPDEGSNKYDDDELLATERYMPQVLALRRNYNESQANDSPLKPNMSFVRLLTVAAKYDFHFHLMPPPGRCILDSWPS